MKAFIEGVAPRYEIDRDRALAVQIGEDSLDSRDRAVPTSWLRSSRGARRVVDGRTALRALQLRYLRLELCDCFQQLRLRCRGCGCRGGPGVNSRFQRDVKQAETGDESRHFWVQCRCV